VSLIWRCVCFLNMEVVLCVVNIREMRSQYSRDDRGFLAMPEAVLYCVLYTRGCIVLCVVYQGLYCTVWCIPRAVLYCVVYCVMPLCRVLGPIV